MNEFSEILLTYLTESLNEITSDSRAYTVNPETDSTQKRKLMLAEMTRMTHELFREKNSLDGKN